MQDKIRQVCTKLNLPKLKVIELEFLEEYAKVTEPVARELDMLKGDKNCFLGALLPTLIALRKKMIDLKQNHSIKHAQALVETILDGLDNRFGHAFKMKLSRPRFKELAIARRISPCSKCRWITGNICDRIIDLIWDEMRNILIAKPEDRLTDCDAEDSKVSSIDSDNFFTFDSDGIGKSTDSSFSCYMKVQLLRLMEDKNRSNGSLKEYLDVARVFRKFNLAIPSSAPVKPFFFYWGFDFHHQAESAWK